MGNETEPISLGGALVYNAKETSVRYNKNNEPIYCVWFEGGAYAEFPEQDPESNVAYYAKNVKTGDLHLITEKEYNKQKTKKDKMEYELIKQVGRPVLEHIEVKHKDDTAYYEDYIEGFDGLHIKGSPKMDIITFNNTKYSSVVTDNDDSFDSVKIGINCTCIIPQIARGFDLISKFAGYIKGEGYTNKFKDVKNVKNLQIFDT